jgi:hypothetical protein
LSDDFGIRHDYSPSPVEASNVNDFERRAPKKVPSQPERTVMAGVRRK